MLTGGEKVQFVYQERDILLLMFPTVKQTDKLEKRRSAHARNMIEGIIFRLKLPSWHTRK